MSSTSIMYVKVFSQILESSIAIDYEQRHVFQDLLILADRHGVVDMTHEAIARRLNVPEPIVRKKIEQLEKPDPRSRNDAEEGRRIIRLDDHRDWGWQIVNYEIYRDMRDEEARRHYFRERKREQRAKGHKMSQMSNGVLDMSQMSKNVTHSESEAFSESDTKEEESPLSPSASPQKKKKVTRPADYEEFADFIMDELRLTENDALSLWEHWEGNGWKNGREPIVKWKSTASNWKRRGIFFPSIQSNNNLGFAK